MEQNAADIVERLRDRAYASKVPDRLCEAAADEIARLRLTDAEREAVAWAERFARSQRDSRDNAADYASTLRGLLERLK